MKQLSLFDDQANNKEDYSGNLNNLQLVVDRLKNHQSKSPDDAPIVVSYGGGTNSTAMLIWMFAHKVIPSAILFADTGAEKPETYEFIKFFDQWLIEHDFPGITTVKYQMKNAKPRIRSLARDYLSYWKTIELASLSARMVAYQNIRQLVRYKTIVEECIVLETLPSKAYGMGKCSVKWKVDVIQSSAKKMFPNAKEIRQLIGIHAGEIRRLLNKNGQFRPLTEGVFRNEYPLILNEINQAGCNALIQAANLPVPPKSACWLCPNAKVQEVLRLKQEHPDLYEVGCLIEEQAMKHDKSNGSIKGLGRSFSWREIGELTPLEMAAIESTSRSCSCID
jgi:hypothetical protein